MVFLTALGMVCLMLSACVVLVIPLVLANTTSVYWLWLYAVYVLVTLLFAGIYKQIYDRVQEENRLSDESNSEKEDKE